MDKDVPETLIGPREGLNSPYVWRGILLDSARTCHDPDTIKTVLWLAHRYGFNRFHWHLTDDQGWRFAVPGYPGLIDVGAYVERDDYAHYTVVWNDSDKRAINEAPGRWRNGYYTDEEIRDIVSYADSLGIQVVPEVDFPGHMAAAIQAYPEVGRPQGLPLPQGSMRENSYWPARNDLLWPTPEALDLVKAAIGRVMELFPGEYVHIGGDECAYKQWESDPGLAGWMSDHGVESYPQIQQWFMREGIEVIRRAGRTPVVWDEACSLVDDDVLVIAWEEAAGMERIKSAAQIFVYADARFLYLNKVDPNGDDSQKGMIDPISVDDILSAPWPETTSSRCVGVQACLWSEFLLDREDVLQMALPRLVAVAARLWCDPKREDTRELIEREYEVISRYLGMTKR